MPEANLPALLPPTIARYLGWVTAYLLLAMGIFLYPNYPSSELDPSWRMALGYFFEHGSQFGTEVVFPYGPLGFVMARTYSGLQFWRLIGGQAIWALVAALVIIRQVWRAQGSARLFGLGYFFLFGTIYEDALHMLVIAMLGFEALRSVDDRRTGLLAVVAAVLAVFSLVKFTDLVLAAIVVLITIGYAFSRRSGRSVGVLAGTYAGVYLMLWVCLGQSLFHVPAYLKNSWDLSQGYQWAMGFPAPALQLGLGLFVLFVLVAYGFTHWWLNPSKPRGTANLLMLGAFVYLNWKHGFIRPDGHMFGFFICAMLPMALYPHLLDDQPRFVLPQRWIFLVSLAISIWAMEVTIGGVASQALGAFQGRIWNNIRRAVSWSDTRQQYREHLIIASQGADLKKTRALVGNATVDVLGSEQGIALFNKLNYHPRPVFQGYSVFTPALSKLNADFYASAQAPEYVLMKVQSIDYRLPMMDDSEVLHLLIHRYEFLFSESGYLVWKRKPGPFNPAVLARQPEQAAELPIATPFKIEPKVGRPLWLRIDLQPSLLGRIRGFFYRPPQVKLKLATTNGDKIEYLMPLPQGRTGFIINPLIEDFVDYLQFASNSVQKHVARVWVEFAPGDEIYFASSARYELSSLTPGDSTQTYVPKDVDKKFYMFKNYPVAFESALDIAISRIAGTDVAVLHAPSQMVFEIPPRAQLLTGQFGFVQGAYTSGGNTDGADFLIYWTDGTRRSDLFQRFLDPVAVEADRGLQNFKVEVKNLTGGRIYFETKPGPFNDTGWDWTGWTNIKFTR